MSTKEGPMIDWGYPVSWIVAKETGQRYCADLHFAKWLGFKDPTRIRGLIRRNLRELELHAEVLVLRANCDAEEAFVLTETQMLAICMMGFERLIRKSTRATGILNLMFDAMKRYPSAYADAIRPVSPGFASLVEEGAKESAIRDLERLYKSS
jgi:hypothetical protein